MTFSDLVILGDKIDIHLVSQLSRENSGGIAAKLYKSSVTDIFSQKEIEISMPMDGPKMVLFQDGLRIDMVFYSKRGLYRCQGLVAARYKKDNLYLLRINQKTELEKFQRREYFRIDCSLEFRIYPITEEVAALTTTPELYRTIQDPEYLLSVTYGKLLDISGGGIRFTDQYGFQVGDYVLTEFRLTNDKVDQTFYLVNQIVASDEKEDEKGVFINRAKFLYKDLKDREKIVRYVFEEERRVRRTEGR